MRSPARPDLAHLRPGDRAHELGSDGFDALAPRFPDLPGRRAVIDVAVERVTTSCGYAVPLMDLVGDRDRLLNWASTKGDTLDNYQREAQRQEY